MGLTRRFYTTRTQFRLMHSIYLAKSAARHSSA